MNIREKFSLVPALRGLLVSVCLVGYGLSLGGHTPIGVPPQGPFYSSQPPSPQSQFQGTGLNTAQGRGRLSAWERFLASDWFWHMKCGMTGGASLGVGFFGSLITEIPVLFFCGIGGFVLSMKKSVRATMGKMLGNAVGKQPSRDGGIVTPQIPDMGHGEKDRPSERIPVVQQVVPPVLRISEGTPRLKITAGQFPTRQGQVRLFSGMGVRRSVSGLTRLVRALPRV